MDNREIERQVKLIKAAIVNAIPEDVQIVNILTALGQCVSIFAGLLWVSEENKEELERLAREELEK